MEYLVYTEIITGRDDVQAPWCRIIFMYCSYFYLNNKLFHVHMTVLVHIEAGYLENPRELAISKQLIKDC
jgi:hypothetical protein